MNYRKGYLVALITAFAIIINLVGRYIATTFNLPIWLDSFGTVLIAYIYGPVCGGIVGLFNNIIYGVFVENQSIYCFVGVVLGVTVGILAKRGAFESLFRVVTLGVELALLCTFMAVPLDILLFDCMTGNDWSNQIILMCTNNQISKVLACAIAQFYIEFLDKQLCVCGVYLILKLKKIGSVKLIKTQKHITSLMIFMLFFVLMGSQFVYANEQEDYDSYTHTFYSSDEGLLAGEANDIEQTKEGQIWIGTYAGLYSYDGISFKLYNDIDSVKNVKDLYVDEEGRLWVGTNDNGVTTMINGHVMNILNTDSGLLANSVRSIVCDSNGEYYIGTTSGISIVTLSGGVKIVENFSQVKNPICMCADEEGRVLVISDNGEMYHFQDGKLVKSVSGDTEGYTVKSAFLASDGKLYMGTAENVVLVYSDATRSYQEKKIVCGELESINSFYENENGEIFICSDNGVGYLDINRKFHAVNTERFVSSIEHMLIDYQGNIWFSSSRQGLLKLCKSSFESLFAEVSEIKSVVNAVLCYEGKVWCGTDDGLMMIDEKMKRCVSNELTELLAGVRIRNLYVDADNNMWIATTGKGLFKVTITENGYDIKNIDEKDGMPGRRIRSITLLKNGELVAAGDEGIAFIAEDRVTGSITAKEGLSNIKSLCVLEYNDQVYVGSDGGGITVIDGHNIKKNITKRDGLSSDVILRMIYDEVSGGMFIVASNGLCYMSPEGIIKKLNRFPYSNNYDVIPGEEGIIWILCSAGIYVANSEQLVENINEDYELLN